MYQVRISDMNLEGEMDGQIAKLKRIQSAASTEGSECGQYNFLLVLCRL